jgi:chemosensory pili system protein ChpA (sensor histidine kinase/response regulator)
MEDLLDWLYEDATEITPEIVNALLDSGDLLDRFVTRPQESNPDKVHAISRRFGEIMGLASSAEDMDAALEEPETMIDMKEVLKSPESSLPVGAGTEEGDGQPFETISDEKMEAPLSDVPLRQTKTLRVGMERVDELVNLASELMIALSAANQQMDVFKDAVSELELSRDRMREIARDLEVGYEVKALKHIQPLHDR